MSIMLGHFFKSLVTMECNAVFNLIMCWAVLSCFVLHNVAHKYSV